MRTFAFILSLAAATSALAGQSLLPESRSSERYTEMMGDSPFVLATPTEAPQEKKESFAANWYISGMWKELDPVTGAERESVAIRSRDNQVAFTLLGGEASNDPDAKGVTLASVQRVDKPRKSTVMLRKGTELAKVEYGEANTPTAAPPNGASNRGAPVPALPRVGPAPGPAAIRTTSNLTPGINPMPANQTGAGYNPASANRQLPPGLVPPGMPEGSQKRRVRVINSQ